MSIPVLIVKPVPGSTANRPENLVWGYMYDRGQRHIHNQKYNFFGLASCWTSATRIRCAECGEQVHGQNQLINGKYCGPCLDIVNARNPPEKPQYRRSEWRDQDLYFPGHYRPLQGRF